MGRCLCRHDNVSSGSAGVWKARKENALIPRWSSTNASRRMGLRAYSAPRASALGPSAWLHQSRACQHSSWHAPLQLPSSRHPASEGGLPLAGCWQEHPAESNFLRAAGWFKDVLVRWFKLQSSHDNTSLLLWLRQGLHVCRRSSAMCPSTLMTLQDFQWVTR